MNLRACHVLYFAVIIVLFTSACTGNQKLSNGVNKIGDEDVIISTEIVSEENNKIELENQVVVDDEEISKDVSNSLDNEDNIFKENPTPDNRLKPEKWQEWDIVPEISQNAIDIYKNGIELGNDPKSFSKIGDCQSISQVLLGIYDHSDRYHLTEEQSYLEETIENFIGSFDRDGMAVKGGFNAAAVLSPIWADPDICRPGETPIECEFRVHKPSIVIISLEVWWEGRTDERYEEYMRKIINFSIENGVLPILSTKADNVEKDHSINYTTAKLAYEYDIPLWNFWRAVQPLPYRGIDPARDGFHITTEAWTVRSFSALLTLDAVRTSVLGIDKNFSKDDRKASDDKGDIDTINLSQVVIENAGYSIKKINTSGRILFNLSTRRINKLEDAGIYSFNLNTGFLTQIEDQGLSIESISPDEKQMIVNQNNILYFMNIGENADRTIITDNYFDWGTKGTHWGPDQNTIFAIIKENGKNEIYQYSLFGSNVEHKKVTDGTVQPVEIITSTSNSMLFYKTGECSNKYECDFWDVQQIDLTDMSQNSSYDYSNPKYSPDQNFIADKVLNQEGKAEIIIERADDSNKKIVQLPADYLMDYLWSNNNDKLLVLKLVRSDYSGKASEIRIFAVHPQNWLIEEYSPIKGITAQADWSPDNQQIFISRTIQLDSSEYQVNFYLYDIASKKLISFDDVLTVNARDYIIVRNLYWLEDNTIQIQAGDLNEK